MNKEKKHLVTLAAAVSSFLIGFDKVMKLPESRVRGEKLAKLCNWLDMKNDSAMKFGMGFSWNRINKTKVRDIGV